MMNNIDWNSLAKYLSGECSEAEEEAIRTWMEADTTRGAFMNELRQVWEANPEGQSDWDVDALWDDLDERIQKQKPIRQLSAPRSRPEMNLRRLRPHSIAAAIAIVAVATVMTMILMDEPPSSIVEEGTSTVVTHKGQRASIQLSDDTHVRLNVDTRLTIPDTFGETSREVELEGEAYFAVTANEGLPFIIHTGHTVTMVLGTEFNVNAYPDAAGVEVAVINGKVAVREREGLLSDDDLVLTRHQLGQVFRSGERSRQDNVAIDRYIAWMDSRLVFEGASFAEVARQLERWYDLDIELPGSIQALGHLNATFTDQSLGEILNVIALAFGLDYERDGKAVTFIQAARP